MKKSLFSLLAFPLFISCNHAVAGQQNQAQTNSSLDKASLSLLQSAKLFVTLPDSCPTPDALDISPEGSLILSCANFADKNQPGVLLRITKDRNVTKLLDVPILKKTGRARPMGIAFDEKGYLYIADNQGRKGRLLRLKLDKDKLIKTDIIASGFQSINGIRFYNGAIYATQSNLPKFTDGSLVSGLYRFKTSERNIVVNNDDSDRHLIYKNRTKNAERQVGLDGLSFDKAGHLYVGDLGDAEIFKLTLSESGQVTHSELFAQLPPSSAPDGINIDEDGNLYVAGFAHNQIFKIGADRVVQIISENPDSDGADGSLDQPADLIVFGNKLVISNFDLMVTSGMLNSKHSKPFTLSYLDMKNSSDE